jgi:CheY-like chemotaxis protein/two-component sensor histidine kinase
MVQEQLQEVDRRKDEFLATLAHELRNPLAPIRTGLAILQKECTPSQAAKAREMMERQLFHMVRLVDDLLDVSRITTSRLTLKKDKHSARSIIEAAVEASRPLIDAANHTLTVTSVIPDIEIYCDATRVAQTISNILTNAAKYTPDGGRINLLAGYNESTLQISISDNGLGIPPDMLEHIFDLFGQVNRTLHRSQGGLGIGLALVKTLLNLHGGSISVVSPGINQGSTFTITLPRGTQSQAQSLRQHGSQATGEGMTQKRVLIVDDNVDGAESLAIFAELIGHKSEIAHSGPEALERIPSYRPDVILLDIGLPGMSGFEVAQMIRATPQGLQTKLVALTGWGSEETKRQAHEAGFNEHLTKPVELTDIERILGA